MLSHKPSAYSPCCFRFTLKTGLHGRRAGIGREVSSWGLQASVLISGAERRFHHYSGLQEKMGRKATPEAEELGSETSTFLARARREVGQRPCEGLGVQEAPN